MKVILCYGDSNTWGSEPATGARFPVHKRWPGVLGLELGNGYHVIEEGLCGRTTVIDDPLEPSRNGRTYLVPCLASHAPLDLVIIMLGTNDLKCRFSLPVTDIACGVALLVEIVLNSGAGPNGQAPAVLVLAPPPIGELRENADELAGAQAKSRAFGKEYRRVAELCRCHFLDACEIISSSAVDGVHLDASAHIKLGEAVAKRVRAILR